MAAAPTASLVDRLLASTLGSSDPSGANRLAVEGLTWGSRGDGLLELGIRKLEAASLRLASGPLALQLAQATLHDAVAVLRVAGGAPRLQSFAAAGADLSGVKIEGPLSLELPAGVAGAAAPGAWSLAPLATADGTINAEIVDAHLIFDADVTVPIRQGQVTFKDATVEHVGPDSRMGVSRMGLYVDAPNGRSYLYQFTATPVAGVEYERRGALLGPWVTDRGRLALQPFGESVLRQGRAAHGPGLTEQARLLFERTAVSGHVQLGDGRFAVPGLQADFTARAGGRNLVRLHSEAVGRGLTVDVASLALRNVVLGAGGAQLRCDDLSGALTLRIDRDGAQLRFAIEGREMKAAGMRFGTGA